MIRVVLPHHLRTLAGVRKEVELEVAEPVTQAALLDALEARYPALRGTMSRPTRRCQQRWRPARSRSWWWGRWPAANTRLGRVH